MLISKMRNKWSNIISFSASATVPWQFRYRRHHPVLWFLLFSHLLHCLWLLCDSRNQSPSERSSQSTKRRTGKCALPGGKSPAVSPRSPVPAMAVPQHWTDHGQAAAPGQQLEAVEEGGNEVVPAVVLRPGGAGRGPGPRHLRHPRPRVPLPLPQHGAHRPGRPRSWTRSVLIQGVQKRRTKKKNIVKPWNLPFWTNCINNTDTRNISSEVQQFCSIPGSLGVLSEPFSFLCTLEFLSKMLQRSWYCALASSCRDYILSSHCIPHHWWIAEKLYFNRASVVICSLYQCGRFSRL